MERAVDSRWMNARNLLLVRLDNLGDVLLCTPAFHAVRETLPTAKLTLLAAPMGAQVAEMDPDLDEVIVYEAPWMDPWGKLAHSSAREAEMIHCLKERAFDGAIIFTSYRQSSLPAAYLCYLADIPLRLAVSVDGSGSLLTTRHKHPERLLMHEVERALDLVGAEGMRASSQELVMRVPEEALSTIRERLESEGITQVERGSIPRRPDVDPSDRGDSGGAERDKPLPYQNRPPLVVIHPGCSMPARTYPWEMFAEVADLLIQELGARVVLTGTRDEVELVERVRRRMRNGCHSMAGRATFPEFAALISLSDLVITNNTGPAHVAAAVKTPVVDLFALTNPPQQWMPWRVPHRLLSKQVSCAICYSRVCPYQQECLRGVSPAEVLVAAMELLDETRGGAPRGQAGSAGILPVPGPGAARGRRDAGAPGGLAGLPPREEGADAR